MPETRWEVRTVAESAHTSPGQTVALVAICLGYFMTILDTTIVNVALPDIAKGLGAGVAGLQWVVDGYALVFAALLLSGGALGDRFGGKEVFLAGLALFSAASALCGVAPTLGLLVAFRMIQGLGAALLVPTSLVLLRHTFVDTGARARATGVWGGIAGIAAAAGPVLGGVLVAALSWRSVFLINVPIGILGALLTLRFVAPTPRLPRRGFDPLAQAAGIVALACLTFAVIEGGARGWRSPLILGALGVFVLATAAFIAIEWRGASPMLPLGLFGNPSFAAPTVVGFLINFGFYGQLFVINLFFQQVWGYSPLLAGLALLPESGVVALSSFLSGRVTGRAGPRLPMVIGLVVGGVGLLALILVGATTAYIVLCALLIAIGFGMSFTMPAMTAAVMEAAPSERAGIASAVLNASRQVGGVLGVALLGALVSGRDAFVPGLHVAGAIAGAAFLVGCILTLRAVPRGRPRTSAC